MKTTPPIAHPGSATSFRLILLGCLLTLVLAAGSAQAATTTGTGGEYTTTTTWTGNVVPTITDGDVNVDINGNDTVTVTSGTAGAFDRLRIGVNAGTAGTFIIQGGTFVAAGSSTNNTQIGVNAADTGTFTITSGLGQFNSQAFQLGVGASNLGVVNISGGTLDQSGGDFTVGNVGTGLMNVTGGLFNTANNLIVGNTSPNAVVNVDTAGTVVVDQSLNVGNGANSVATMNIGPGGVVNVGEAGTDGVGGGFNVIRVGNNATSTGVINLTGGSLVSLDTDTGIRVAENGDGTINIGGGVLSAQGSLTLGQNQGPIGDPSSGTVVQTAGIVNLADAVALDGGGTRNSGDDINVGLQGRGAYDITGGTIEVDSTFVGQPGGADNTNRQIRLGQRAGSYGTMHVGGTAFVHANELTVGEGDGTDNQNAIGVNNAGQRAIGDFTMSGGTAVFDGVGSNATTANGAALFIGEQDDSSGTYNQTGGLMLLNGDLLVANQGAVTLHTNPAGGGGNGATRFGSVFGAAEGFFDISGGTLHVGNNTGGGDDFIVGVRGLGTGHIHGTAVIEVDGNLVLGNTFDSFGSDTTGAGIGVGVVSITGAASPTVTVDGDIIVGNEGTGVLNVDGAGTVLQTTGGGDDLLIANSFVNASPTDVSHGTVNLDAGLVDVDNTFVGNRGLGFYNQSGGTLHLRGSYVMGDSGSNTLALPTIVAGTGFANITGGLVDIDDQLVLGDGNQGATGGIEYQDSRAALGSMNVGGSAFVQVNSGSADGVNDDSHTEVGLNGTGFLTVSGGTLLTNHAGAIGTNAADGDGGEDETDLRLGVTSSLNAGAIPNTAGDAPFGQVEVSAGALIVARDLNAGLGSFSTGNVIVSGGMLQVDGDVRLADGNDSVSNSSISGGTVQTGFALRNSATSDGGAFIIADGERSSALLDVSGGRLDVAAELFVGNGADSQGTLNVSGTGVVEMGFAGDNGAGAGFQEMFIGNNATATGVVNLSGGSLINHDVNGPIYVGVNGDGTINMSGGDLATQGSITLGQNQGPIGDPSSGTVVQTGGIVDLATAKALPGGGTRNEGDHLQIGFQGRGAYDITGGTIEIDSQFDGQASADDNSDRLVRIGMTAGSYGTMHIGGTAFVHAEGIRVGEGSTDDNANDAGRNNGGRAIGVLSVSGGNAEFDGTGGGTAAQQSQGQGVAMYVGLFDDSSGTYNQSGGHVRLNGDLIFADRGAVTLHTNPASGGGNGATRFGSVFGASEGFFDITGGTLDVGNGSGGGDVTIVGQRGLATGHIGGSAVVNLDSSLILGHLNDSIGTDVGGAGVGTGIVSQDGGLVQMTGVDTGADIIIGNSGVGEYSISGGTLRGIDDVIIGNRSGTNEPAGTGTLTISGADTVVEAGNGGGGDDFILANTFDNDNPTDVSHGTMNLMSGLATGGNMIIGNRGLGFYNQTGGTLELLSSFVMGDSGSNTLASVTIVAGTGFANITGGLVDIDDALVLGDGNQGDTPGGSGVEYQDSRAALGSMNVGGAPGSGALVRVNSDSDPNGGNDNESNTEIGFNGTGFLTISGGTLLTNHAGAIGTNAPDDNLTPLAGGNDGADLRLGASNALNDTAASLAAGTKVLNTASSAPFGQVEVSAGALIVARDLLAGVGSFATGNVIVSGGSLAVDGDILLADGNDSRSMSSISGGVVETGRAARHSGTNDGGNINVADGARSSALLDVTGGKVIVAANLIVGNGADSNGTMNISGSAVVNVGETGNNGVGGGNNDILIGNNALATGLINLSGGSLVALDGGRPIQVGVNGDGRMNITGGVLAGRSNLTLAQNQGPIGDPSSGTVVQTGGVVNLADPITNDGLNGPVQTFDQADDLFVGLQGRGFYDITGGTIELDSTFNIQPDGGADDATDRSLRIAQRAGSYGTMHIGGTALVHGTELRVGEGDATDNQDATGRNNGGRAIGELTISGGSVVFHGGGDDITGSDVAMYIGLQDDSSGTYTQTGGHVVLSGDIVVANQGVVTLHTNPASGGGNGATRFATVFGASEGFFSITGGSLDVGNGSGSSDNFIVGQRGLGTGFIGGTADVNIDDELLIGNTFDTVGTDTTGAGSGVGVVTIGGSADVLVGADTVTADIRIANNNETQGTLNVEGSAVVSADQILVGDGSGTDNVIQIASARAIGVMNVSGGSVTSRNGGTSMVIGEQDDTSGTYNQSGGHVKITGSLIMADIGTITHHTNPAAGGGNGATRFASVFGAAEGFFNMTGGTLDIGDQVNGDNDWIIGQRGNATASATGGVINIQRNLTLGNLADGIGTDTGGAGTGNGSLTIGGSAVVNVGVDLADTAGDVIIGNGRNTDDGPDGGASGDVTVTGSGTLLVRDDILVANQNGTQGAFSVGGSATVEANQLIVGQGNGTDNVPQLSPNRATGVVNISGGLSSFSNGGTTLAIGSQDDTSGTYNQSGGHVILNGDIIVADIGAITHHTDPAAGGGNGATRFSSVFGAAEGFFDISGGTLDVGNGDAGDNFIVGQRGLGTGHIHGDAVVNIDAGSLILGNLADGIGTDTGGAGTGQGIVTISGAASPTVTIGNDIVISNANGNNLDNILNIEGGIVDVADQVFIANGSGRKGTLNISGGTTLIGTRLLVGGGDQTSAATYNQTGGVVQLGVSGGAAGTFTIDDDVDPDLDKASISGGVFQPSMSSQNIHLAAGPSNDLVISGGTLDMRHGSLIDETPVGGTFNSNNDLILSGGGLLNTAGGSVEADLEMSGGVFDMSADGLNFGVTNFRSGGSAAAIAAGGLGTAQRNVTATGGTVVFTLTADSAGAAAAVGTDANGIIADDIAFTGATIKIATFGVSSSTFDIGDQWDLLDRRNFTTGGGGGGSFDGGGTFDFSMASLFGTGGVWDTSLWAAGGDGGIIQIIAAPFSFVAWSNLPAWTAGTFAAPLPVNVDGNNAGDGVDNFEKYAFNMDPTIETVQILTPSTGTVGLPFVSYGVNERIKVEYIRRKSFGSAQAVSDIQYTVEFSTDLQNWVQSSNAETVTNTAGPDFDRVTIEDDTDSTSDTMRYTRIHLLYQP